jgi:hypothetical protein
MLNGQPFIRAWPQPATYGLGTLAAVQDGAQRGRVPAQTSIGCSPEGDVAVAMSFPLRLAPGGQESVIFTVPAEPGGPLPQAPTGALEDAHRVWDGAIGPLPIVIPDGSITAAYRASLGYLLLALDRQGPRPGPLEHSKFWVRDAAFIGEALLMAGKLSMVQAYLPRLFDHQEADGRIPPIIGPSGPEPENEWDSQGEAIFLVAAIYRYSRDKRFLEQWEPSIKFAAGFIRELRSRTAADPPATRGLLPPSRSAEDLGSDKWRHYWDDYWAVAGLEEAAYIEDELGRPAQAAWMRAEAQELRRAIRASIEAVMGPQPAYIPGAPEDLDSSAMARGNSVALYPVEVFPINDPLMARSFQEYHRRWIDPNQGAYSHLWGQFWPYGGLGLARDYLRLGRQDVVHQILAWTLTHQTLPGTYAWAEQVSPVHGGITGGDMPHAWAAASFIALIREMLVMRRGDTLELFAGVPPSWLDQRKQVGVRNASTEFGVLTAMVESDLATSGDAWSGRLTLTISGEAQPPGGFFWALPKPPDKVSGPSQTTVQGGRLWVPPQGGTIVLEYGQLSPGR